MTVRSLLLRSFGCGLLIAAATAAGLHYRTSSAVAATIAVAGLLAYVLIALRAARQIASPMASLRRDAKAAGDGDLTRRAACPALAEWGELASHINRLIDRAEAQAREVAALRAQVCGYEQKLEREKVVREEQAARRSRELLAKTERAAKDDLTGLLNRREAQEKLRLLFAAGNLHRDPPACILLDIDHFKRFNDSYGHAAGDLVLRELAAVLQRNVRVTDTVCRWGGEEFVVLCPEGAEAEAADCAEKLRRAVEAHTFRYNGLQLHVTISLGVAERTPAMLEPDDVMKAADECLYKAKWGGRNRVVVAGEFPGSAPPAMLSAERASANPAEAPAADRGAPVRVGLALDDQSLRAEWAGCLRARGMEVAEVERAGDLATAARDGHFDVLVLSAEPAWDGVCDRVRKLRNEARTRDLPIVLVGPEGVEPVEDEVLEIGVDQYLRRPCPATLLVLAVKALARRHRTKLELVRGNRLHRERMRNISKLFEFSRSLALTPTLDKVLDKTVAVTLELVPCGRVCIMLPDGQAEQLLVARLSGIDDPAARSLKVSVGAGLAGRVFQSGRPGVLATEEDLKRIGPLEDAVFFSAAPALCYPMSAPSGTVGVLGATERAGGGRFTAQELEYLSQISNMAAAAVADIMSRESRDAARDSIVETLGKLAEYRDDSTGQHLLRVMQYSLLLAATLRKTDEYRHLIDDQFLSDLARAVPLHDIGKIGIPDRILLKNRRLTLEEMAVMKRHVEIGVETIQSVKNRVPGVGYLQMALDICAGHHEWYNGNGYPRGLKGTQIPLAARIVAVADAYDAMTTQRPYKPAYRHADAVQLIYQNSATQFDPAVVEAFRKQEQQFALLADEFADIQTRAGAEGGPAGFAERREIGDEPIELYDLAPLD